MKKAKRLENRYTKWCILSDGWGGETIDELWGSGVLDPWLIGDEDVVADEIEWGEWNQNKLKKFAKRLDVRMLGVITDDDETTSYTILPVYSYQLTRKENKHLVSAFIETFVDPGDFLEYHKRDLSRLLGKRAYNKMVNKYVKTQKELP